jgi:hypothetical protein
VFIPLRARQPNVTDDTRAVTPPLTERVTRTGLVGLAAGLLAMAAGALWADLALYPWLLCLGALVGGVVVFALDVAAA